jgi:hypothetical protein
MVSGPSWGRRYGAESQRLCARTGCSGLAAATLRFLPTQREAWLIDLDEEAARTEGDLCERHAASLVMPRGWQLHDQRRGARGGDAPTSPAPPLRRPALRARRGDLTAVPVQDDEPASSVEPEAEPEAEAEAEMEAEPAAEPQVVGEALNDVLDARTPLLRRAFQNLWSPGDDS